MITIFLNASGANGFKKWSIAHPPSSNDDDPPRRRHTYRDRRPLDEPIMAPREQPHRPWFVPGWGTL